MKPTARVLVWIELRGLTNALLRDVLNWQIETGNHPTVGGSSGCPVEGRGFYSGAYLPERAETLKMWLVSKGVRLV